MNSFFIIFYKYLNISCQENAKHMLTSPASANVIYIATKYSESIFPFKTVSKVSWTLMIETLMNHHAEWLDDVFT